MALQKTFAKTQEPFIGQLHIIDAYWRVEKVEATKTEANFVVSINKKTDDLFQLIEQKRYAFSVDLTGKNFIKQAYEYLKTLPEFAGATDC